MAQYTSEKLHIATYSNGNDGNGISKITNYYFAHTSDKAENLPAKDSGEWKTSISELTNKPFNETNKYLWNFEHITYTRADPFDTKEEMIAVYSKDGKGIKGIYEYYLLTEKSDKPSAPTLENKGTWMKEGDKDNSGNLIPIPIPTAEKPFLWNYEIIDYTEGNDTTSGPVCIGQYGNSITEVKEWYQATSTSSKPTNQDGGTEGSSWKKTIAEAGHGADKPYLWNYEETSYSATNSICTPTTLLTTEPRTIKTITEYYQQRTVDKGAPSGVIWRDEAHNHQDGPIIPAGWSTMQGDLEKGHYMWNMEVIEFNAVDEDGKNLFTATPPAIVGYAGVDGASAKDFNITASSYAFVKAKEEDSTYKNSITLTAHKLNLGEAIVYWQKKDGENFVNIQENGKNVTGNTYTPTGPGTYRGVIYKSDNTTIEWSDEVVLVETVDGATGKNAIAIVLSNPTMIFHGNTSGESESCEVIVYEGGTLLGYSEDDDDNGTFEVEKADEQEEIENVNVEEGIVTIADKAVNGSYKITVTVRTSTGETSSQDFTIKWKVVYDGVSPYTLSLDEDFISVPATNDGTVSNFPSTPIMPKVYLGRDEQDFNKDNSSLKVEATINGLKGNWNANKQTYTVTSFDDTEDNKVDSGTVTFKLTENGTEKAQATFTAVKQKAGPQGDAGTYVYAKASANIIERDNLPNSIVIEMYQRTGSGEPQKITNKNFYYVYSLNGEEGYYTGTSCIIGKDNYLVPNKNGKTLQINVYTDSGKNTIIDRLTIELVSEEKREWYLYSSAEGRPALPSDTNWSNYTSNTDWSQTQDNNSVWYINKGGAYSLAEQATQPWKGPYRLDGSVSMTYNDWFNVLDDKEAEEGGKGIYKLDDNGTVGISANVIQTGALRVGTPSDEQGKPWKNAKFYADIDDNSSVYIGGWQVTENSIRNIPDEVSGETIPIAGIEHNSAVQYKDSPVVFWAGDSHAFENQLTFNAKISGMAHQNADIVVGEVPTTMQSEDTGYSKLAVSISEYKEFYDSLLLSTPIEQTYEQAFEKEFSLNANIDKSVYNNSNGNLVAEIPQLNIPWNKTVTTYCGFDYEAWRYGLVDGVGLDDTYDTGMIALFDASQPSKPLIYCATFAPSVFFAAYGAPSIATVLYNATGASFIFVKGVDYNYEFQFALNRSSSTAVSNYTNITLCFYLFRQYTGRPGTSIKTGHRGLDLSHTVTSYSCTGSIVESSAQWPVSYKSTPCNTFQSNASLIDNTWAVEDFKIECDDSFQWYIESNKFDEPSSLIVTEMAHEENEWIYKATIQIGVPTVNTKIRFLPNASTKDGQLHQYLQFFWQRYPNVASRDRWVAISRNGSFSASALSLSLSQTQEWLQERYTDSRAMEKFEQAKESLILDWPLNITWDGSAEDYESQKLILKQANTKTPATARIDFNARIVLTRHAMYNAAFLVNQRGEAHLKNIDIEHGIVDTLVINNAQVTDINSAPVEIPLLQYWEESLGGKRYQIYLSVSRDDHGFINDNIIAVPKVRLIDSN